MCYCISSYTKLVIFFSKIEILTFGFSYVIPIQIHYTTFSISPLIIKNLKLFSSKSLLNSFPYTYFDLLILHLKRYPKAIIEI